GPRPPLREREMEWFGVGGALARGVVCEIPLAALNAERLRRALAWSSVAPFKAKEECGAQESKCHGDENQPVAFGSSHEHDDRHYRCADPLGGVPAWQLHRDLGYSLAEGRLCRALQNNAIPTPVVPPTRLANNVM